MTPFEKIDPKNIKLLCFYLFNLVMASFYFDNLAKVSENILTLQSFLSINNTE